MAKIIEALSESDKEFVGKVIDEDCALTYNAEKIISDLKQFLERIHDYKVKGEHEATDIKDSNEKVVQLSEQVQKLITMHIQEGKEVKKEEKEEHDSCSVKLPKLDLTSFGGNKLKWAAFWDAFECTVHNNTKLSNIEKFSYLLSKVFGDAKRAIDGLALSHHNYHLALGILKERFGNVQDIVDIHYNELLGIPAPDNNVRSLRTFLDNIERHLRSLEVLKQDVNQDVFVSMIRLKLPQKVLQQLELMKGSKNKWTVDILRNKLCEYVSACEHAWANQDTQKDRSNFQVLNKKHEKGNKPTGIKQPSGYPNQNHSTGSFLTKESRNYNKEVKRNICRYCGDKHWSDECMKYKTVEERKNRIRGSCFRCLKEGHKSPECKSNKTCVYCGDGNVHHRSLCPKKFNIKQASAHLSEEILDTCTAPSEQERISEGQALVSANKMVLMQTASTKAKNPSNSNEEAVRLLLDSGSQRTYVTEQLAAKLGLKAEGGEQLKLVTFGSDKSKVIKTKSTKIDIKLNNGTYMSVTANIIPTISGLLQKHPVSKLLSKRMEHIVQSVQLADSIPTETEPSTVELLIGNDYYLDVVLPQRIEVEPGLYLLGSKLGWILTARTLEVVNDDTESNMLILTHRREVTKNIVFSSIDSVAPTKPDLEDFWNTEAIGIIDTPNDSTNDQIAMQRFKRTLQFQNGRYQVTWPWREENYDLPENRQLVVGRLRSTVSRLRNMPELMEKYDSVLKDQLHKGVIEKVDNRIMNGVVHYIPHHAVITPQKTTTKLLVVYDASAKTKASNKSLNECLYRGPVILQDLCGILMRFRLHNIALVADIEKAFLQIGLQPSQRDVTRFLWLKDCGMSSTEALKRHSFRSDYNPVKGTLHGFYG